MKVAVCVIVKNENLYIREWIEYNKKLGFANIILYDNNDSEGGEDILPVIQEYIDSGFIIYHYFKDKKVCQAEAYNECYKKYKDKYEWIAFIDADEFFYINDKDINSLLSNKRYNGKNVIKIAWRVYGDNDHLHYEAGPVLKRFTTSPHITISHFAPNYKVILRNNIDRVCFTGPHFIVSTPDLVACNSLGTMLNNGTSIVINEFSNIYIKHIWCKSTEEFIKKIKRGYPDQIHNADTIKWQVTTYLMLNRATEEKIKMFKEAFPDVKL